MKENKILLIDGINDYSAIKKINNVNPINYEFLLLASYFKKEQIMYIDNRDIAKGDSHNAYDLIANWLPNYIFINVNLQNMQSVLNLKLHKFKSIKIFLFTRKNNIKDFFIKEDYYIVVYNNKSSIAKQFRSFLENIKNKELLKYFSHASSQICIDTNLISASNKTATITTGYGCYYNCKFCNLANSTPNFRDIQLIEKEISDYLKLGKRYIHVNNHNLVSNKSFLMKLSNIFNKNNRKEKLIWSTTATSKDLNNLTIDDLKLLKKSGLERIDIWAIHADENISDNYGLPSTSSEVIEVIGKINDAKIASISIKIIIGPENESQTSIRKMKTLIQEAYKITLGKVEFEIEYFVPILKDNITKYFKIIKTSMLKCEPFLPKDSKDFYKQKKLKEELEKYSLDFIHKSIPEMSLQERQNHLLLLEYGLTTKYAYYYLSKSTSSKIFTLKNTNRYIKSSWEVSNELKDYSPIIVSNYNETDEHKFFSYDKLLSGSEKPIIVLNEITTELVKITRNRYSLQKIINMITQKYKIEETEIVAFYDMLEQKDLLFYSKVFKK